MNINSTITLNNGIEMPRLGFGVWQTSNAVATQSVRWAIKHGYRLIDTAKKYGNEPGVGEGLTRGLAENGLTRSDIFLTTKIFIGDEGYQSTLDAFAEQLKNLQTDYVDLVLIHWPVPGKYLDTWKALEKLYLEGKIRAIGVSNFNIIRLKKLLKYASIKPVINQMEFNPLEQEADIKAFCDDHNIQLEAWGPLGHGASLTNPVIKAIAEKYHKTPAQVIIRWELQRGIITIPKSTHEDFIESNTKVFDFELADDDIKAINALDLDKRSGWYGDWQAFGNPNGKPTEVENRE